MTAETLLGRLQSVRNNGASKWMACCPAHMDGRPSLSIAEADDGRVLIHCFAGCSALDVIESVGLTFTDLMPRDLNREHRKPGQRPKFSARDALALINHEITVALIVLEEVNRTQACTDEQYYRIADCAARISHAKATVDG